MSFVSRLAGIKSPPTHISARRAYSIFSKPGGGRFFTAAKPPKALATNSNPGSSTTSTPNSSLSPQEANKENTPIAPGNTGEAVEIEAHESTTDRRSKSTASASSTTPESTLEKDGTLQEASASREPEQSSASTSLFAEEGFLHHPRPPQDQVLLHSFFSLHRPLLLLPMHAQQPLFNTISSTGSIFNDLTSRKTSSSTDTRETKDNELAKESSDSRLPQFEVELGSGRPLVSQDGQSIQVQIGEEDIPEADADAARLLGRSYVVNRIGSFVDWQDVLKTLGDSLAKEEIDAIKVLADDTVANLEKGTGVVMDSVKRKRKRKMNKHIYKKRRKRERAQRRRLGK